MKGSMGLDSALKQDLFKYVLVAIVALAADAGSLGLLVALKINYLVSATIAFLIGTIVNFGLSHGYVFKNPIIKNKAANFSVFVAIGAVSLVLNDFIIWALHSRASLNLAFAKLVAVAFTFFWNFFARRQFLYNHNEVPVAKEINFEG